MTFATDDFNRVVKNEARDLVRSRGWIVKTQPLERLMNDTVNATWKHVNDGVRNKREIMRNVRREMRAKYGSVILIAILMGVISFIVKKILERIWP